MSNDLSNAFGYRKFIEKQGAERPGHAWIKRTPRPGGGYNYEYPDGAGKPVTPQHQADYHHGQMEAHEKRATEHRIARSQLPRGEARQSFHAAIKAHRQAAKLHGEAYSAHRKGSGGAEASHRAEVASDHAHGAAENHAKQSLATHRKGEGLLSRLGHKLVDIPRHVVEHPEGSHSRIAERLAGAFNRSLEKGAPAKVGESRNWGGVQYTKQADGNWTPKAKLNSSPENAPVPRGEPAGELHNFDYGMTHTVDFGDKHGEHDVHVHYNYDHGASQQDVDEGIVQSVGDGSKIDGDPMVVNRHGEDVTHLVSPKEMESLHDRIHDHVREADAEEADNQMGEAEDAWDAERELRDEEERDREADGDEDDDDEVEASLTSALPFFQFVEKGKAARPGETRNWGGTEYTKQPDGGWKPKGAEATPKPATKKPMTAGEAGAAWGQKVPLYPAAAKRAADAAAAKAPATPSKEEQVAQTLMGTEVPRGKPAGKLTGWSHAMNDTLDFNWGKGDANEHDVKIHFNHSPGEKRTWSYPGSPASIDDIMVVNRHGEDITHHVPEPEMKKLEDHAWEHLRQKYERD